MTTPTEVCYYGPCAGGGYHGGWETCEKCRPAYACTTHGCSANDCPNCRAVAALQDVIRQLRVELDDARGHVERLVAARDRSALSGAPPAEHIAALVRDLHAFGSEEDGAPPLVVMRARARQAARVLATLMRVLAALRPAPDDAAALDPDAIPDPAVWRLVMRLRRAEWKLGRYSVAGAGTSAMRAEAERERDAVLDEMHTALAAARAREGADTADPTPGYGVPFFTPDGRGVSLEYVAHLRCLAGLARGDSLAEWTMSAALRERGTRAREVADATDATRWRWLRDKLTGAKWADLPAVLSDLRPDDEKYVTAESLDAAALRHPTPEG